MNLSMGDQLERREQRVPALNRAQPFAELGPVQSVPKPLDQIHTLMQDRNDHGRFVLAAQAKSIVVFAS